MTEKKRTREKDAQKGYYIEKEMVKGYGEKDTDKGNKNSKKRSYRDTGDINYPYGEICVAWYKSLMTID